MHTSIHEGKKKNDGLAWAVVTTRKRATQVHTFTYGVQFDFKLGSTLFGLLSTKGEKRKTMNC